MVLLIIDAEKTKYASGLRTLRSWRGKARPGEMIAKQSEVGGWKMSVGVGLGENVDLVGHLSVTNL